VFLDATLRRNPGLVDAAIELHRRGAIGPNTFVIDIDTAVDNARALAAEADRLGLRLHAMTKQQGRNPIFALAAILGGVPDIVAVDVPEARLLALHGLPLGHVGHLVQVPARDTDEVVGLAPRALTVFSTTAARRVSEAATKVDRRQDVLLRVWKPGDFLYPGQEGGFRLDDVAAAAREIATLSGVRIAGVSSFPCLAADADGVVAPTGNLGSVITAAAILRDDLGLEVREVNAPGVTSTGTLSMIAAVGATHGEPGSALAGNTPLHVGDQPERPAMVYLSEIASIDGDRAYCFGGGFYARSRLKRGLLVHGDDRRLVQAPALPPEVIDYYGTLELDGAAAEVGDAVVFAFRAQAFVGRCQVAAVGGMSTARPEVLGTTDQHGNLLGPDQLPMAPDAAARAVRDRWAAYSAGRSPAA
jgi:predicted amino acid racemase